jgi:copper transport protein
VERRPAVVISALALIAVSASGAPAAEAHARLAESEPADGVALGGAPRQLELRFNEPVSPRFRVAKLIDGRGRVVAGTVLLSGSDRSRLVVRVPHLPRGTYQLDWQVLAENDGHISAGATTFGVGAKPRGATAGGAPPGSTVAPLRAWSRWVDLALLCMLAGCLVVAALLARPYARVRRVLLTTAAATAYASFAFGFLLFARQLHQLRASVAPNASPGDLLAVRWGTLWIAREAALAALAVACVLALRRGSRMRLTACALLVVALCTVHALGGHAAADPQPLAAIAVAAAHVLAAAVWVGSVAAFAVALSVAGGRRRGLARDTAGRFAVVAAGAVGLIAVTGLMAAGSQVASIDALLTTDYGRTLLIKAGLAALAVAFGAYNALLLRRGRAPRLILAEAAVAGSVLLAAAVLAASPPAKGPEFAAPRAVATPTLVHQVGDLLVTATVRPNRPGPNVVTVLTASSRRPPPAPVRSVSVTLQPRGGAPTVVRLGAVGDGRFAGGVSLTQQGPWSAVAEVARGRSRSSATFGWTVDRPDLARPVVHSARRLGPIADRIAAAIVAIGIAVIAACCWARQRPRTIRVARIPAR